MGKRDVIRMCGMVACDSTGAVAWIHELTQPEEFAFKADARHKSTVVFKQMWDDCASNNNDFLTDIEKVLTRRACSTILSLRGVLLRLRQKELLSSIRDRLIALLQPLPQTSSDEFSDDDNVTSLFQPNSTPSSVLLAPKWRLKEAMARDLMHSEAYYTCQAKLAIAAFCSKAEDGGGNNSFAQLTFSHERSILHIRLHSLLSRIAIVGDCLHEPDKAFVNYLLTSFLLSTPSDALKTRVMTTLMSLGPSFGPENVYVVQCPACKEALTMKDLETAECARGHTWGRCSVTFLILTTPAVRTCIGCRRKALLPSESRPAIALADSWVAQALLEAARRCLYCGNRFVQVL